MVVKKKMKKQVFDLDVRGFVRNSIIDVDFGNADKADIVYYFVDKKGLEKHLLKNKKYVDKIAYESFKASRGQAMVLNYEDKQQIVLVGIDKDDDENNKKNNDKHENINFEFEKAGAKAVCYVKKDKKISVCFSNKYIEEKKFKDEKFLVDAYFGFNQKSYRFDKYLTTEKSKKEKLSIEKVYLTIKDVKDNNEYIRYRQFQLEGIFTIRSLGNEPSNVLYPESYVEEVKSIFNKIKNIKVRVIDLKELKKINMNLLIGVAQGSIKEPKVVVVEYSGSQKNSKIDLALVGKGVTFDSGGLSLKPSQYMEGMKGDMIGSATAISNILTIAKLGLKINAVAVIGLVENMPSGSAQKVGDVVVSMSGKSVEIIDTDAEGRLVLADILYYTQKKYQPECMIDFATLTGAIMVALGQERAGVFSNNDNLAKQLKESGDRTGELNWTMPLGEEYQEAIKSNIADLRNLGKTRYGGSATAAAFLENFIDDNGNWAHIDIAGVDFATSNNVFCVADFASGYGVKLIIDFVMKKYVK